MVSYRYRGKDTTPQNLVVSDNKVVVRTSRSVANVDEAIVSEEGRNLLKQLDELKSYAMPEVNVTILQSEGGKKVRDHVRRAFKEEKDVKFAGRVLVEPETKEPIIYTENIFVKFRNDLPEADCFEVLESFDLKLKENQPSYAQNAYFVEAAGRGLEVFKIAETLLDKEEVELAHPELIRRRVHRTLKPHPKQWHLGKTDTLEAHVDIVDAWNKHGVKGEGVTIAIIDNGVETSHPEFSGEGKVVAPHDLLSQRSSAHEWDDPHGTNCAGVACASGKEFPGVAPEAKLMPIRLPPGVGSELEAAAFYWAVLHGADIISCSWGPPDGEGNVSPMPDSTRLGIEYAVKHGRDGKGCVIVWAAGNGKESVDDDGYASHEHVIAVGACTNKNIRSSFSDYGRAIWCVFPGGEHTPPSERHGLYTATVGGHYIDDFQGTSAACPGIAGIAALILCANKELNYQEVKAVLRQASVRLDEAGRTYNGYGHSIYYGYGRPNASEAVAIAQAMKNKNITGTVGTSHSALSDQAVLEAILIRFDPSETTRAGLKVKLQQEVLSKDWILKNVEHSVDCIDALYTTEKFGPSVKDVWTLVYELREQPGVVAVEPSFTLLVPGLGGDLEERFMRSTAFCVPDDKTKSDCEWPLKDIRVFEAWDYTEQRGVGKAFGEGVLIGHPDSGYRVHREFDVERLLLSNDKDFIDDDDDTMLTDQDGNHGLGTGSVIISHRKPGGQPYVTGVAPKAKLMPLRVAKKTWLPVPVLVCGGMRRLRRAINHAVDEGCQVISISLGGLPNSGVGDAIVRAVNEGVIVCAAAGNLVGWVTYPGSDEHAIGVAASNLDRGHWKHSCRGSQVDVTAPGEMVWRALIDEQGQEIVGRSCGTSFSVALTAGIAALWLAHHGRETLIEKYGKAGIVPVFKQILKETCSQSHNLPADVFGAGIVDAEAVLKASLPKEARSRRQSRAATLPLDDIAGIYDACPRSQIRSSLQKLLQVSRNDLSATIDDIGAELIFYFATDPYLYDRFEESMATPSEQQQLSSRESRAVRERAAANARYHIKVKGISDRLAAVLEQ